MSRIRTKPSAETPARGRTRIPELTLIAGGGAAAGASPAPAVRERLVRRARGRLARGYYERPAVRERLVERLWQELFAS